MIVVDIKGVQDAMNTAIGRVNARAGEPVGPDGPISLAVDAVCLVYAACELLLSIAVDVRRAADKLDEIYMATPESSDIEKAVEGGIRRSRA